MDAKWSAVIFSSGNFFFASSQLPSIVSTVNSQQRFKVVGSYQHCSSVQRHKEQEYIYVSHTVQKNVILCLVSYQQLLSQSTATGNEWQAELSILTMWPCYLWSRLLYHFPPSQKCCLKISYFMCFFIYIQNTDKNEIEFIKQATNNVLIAQEMLQSLVLWHVLSMG